MDLHDLSEELPINWQSILSVAQKAHDAFAELEQKRANLKTLETTVSARKLLPPCQMQPATAATGSRNICSRSMPKKCIGCGRCFKVCGRDVMTLKGINDEGELVDLEDDEDDEVEKKIMVMNDEGACIGCGACARVCPTNCQTHATAKATGGLTRGVGWDRCQAVVGRASRGALPAIMSKTSVAKFKIGQVVRHRLLPLRGVVFDIDPEFANTEEWYQSIPVEARPRKDQPFYHLLAENTETQYIAYVSEQNLLPDMSGEPVGASADRRYFRPRPKRLTIGGATPWMH